MLRPALIVTLLAPLAAPALAAPARPTKPTAAQAKAQAAARKAALKAGRAATVAKDYPTAIKQLTEAVRLDPNDARTLGELGWAQYKAGQLSAAEGTLGRALIHVRDPKVEGMLRYNLGRVLEDRGELGKAWAAYRLSLTRRPNKTVRARLDALEARKATHTQATIESLCAEVMGSWDCGPGEDQLKCTCAASKTIESSAAADGGAAVTSAEGHTQINQSVVLRAALLSVKGEGMGSLEAEHLAVQTGTGGWQLIEQAVAGWSPGVGYIHNSGTLKRFEFMDRLSTGEGELLVVQVSNVESDGDYGINTVDIQRRDSTYLCHGGGGRPVCYRLDHAHEDATEVMIEGEPHEGTLRSSEYSVTVELGYGAMTLGAGKGTLPAPLKAGLGRVAYDALGTLPALKAFPLR